MSDYVDIGGLYVPGDYVDPLTRPLSEAYGTGWRSEFDAPYNRTTWAEQLGVVGPYDLREWTWQERLDVLRRCRMVWERNPIANTAITLTTSFCVGKGLQLTCMAEEVEELLNDFINDPDNDVAAAETEFLDALQVDGELFIRLFAQNGKTLMVGLEPWFIPHIKNDMMVPRRKLEYHYMAPVTNGYDQQQYIDEWVPAADVIHVAINRMYNEVRGRSELFRILPWLKAHKDALEEMSRLVRRMSVYYHMKVQGTPSQIQAARSAYREPPPPASFLITDKNTEFSAVNSDLRAPDMSEHSRNLKLMVAVGKRGLPEYMLSEGQNANMATTQSQQLPALRAFAYFQDVMIERVWKPIFKRVIENACAAGLIPEMVCKVDSDGDPIMDDDGQPEMIEACEAFDVRYRDIESDDPTTLAQTLQLAVTNGWLSNESAASKMGYDYTSEKKKIDAEKEMSMSDAYNIAPGMTGPATPLPTETGAPIPAQTGGAVPANSEGE